MESLGEIVKHPNEIYPLLKLKKAVITAQKQIPEDIHWGFCYSMLFKVSKSFALIIHQLNTELRNAVCVLYLVLRALDTVEDDMSIATEVKLPILKDFHQHIYDLDWRFSCGTKHYKVLMEEFSHVSTAFLELDRGYQVVIEDIAKRMGAGMAKFICNEVETVDDYDEYCHYVAGLVGLGLSKLFHNSGLEDLPPANLSNSVGLFLQKTNIIRDFLEDINEIPKCRMFWPREIWCKYVDALEELKYEKNSTKSIQCLNEMVTNALLHVDDCLVCMSALRDPAILRSCAIPQIMAIGTLALCYNNIQVFKGVVKMRLGLAAKLIDQTNTMADVYGAFYDFTCILKQKIDKTDPNAAKTLSRIEAIQKRCSDSGTLNKRKLYVVKNKPRISPVTLFVIFVILAIILARPPVCIFYLVLRALDTVEDDTSIATDVKVPILKAFHKHIYDRDWHFSCGTKHYKVLMDEFHHVSTAFLELDRGYQEAIEDITQRMGAGMAKFICNEVETVDDYDEYCHYVAGLVGLGLSKLFHNSGKEDLLSDSLSNSMGLFLQKTNIIRDYLEDINEIPKCRMFWPREIWSKYVDKLEELKYEENSEKAVQCLNEMVTNALLHVEDCLVYMAALRDSSIFRFCAIPQIMAIGTLALCYNNVQVFRGVVKMRRGLTAIVIDQTNTMADVYGAFFDFACMLKPKISKSDPNATKTLSRIKAIQKICKDSGTLNKRKLYVVKSKSVYGPVMMFVIFVILAIILAQVFSSRQNSY